MRTRQRRTSWHLPLILWFRPGGFAGVTFTFDPKSFFTVESAFKERYGPPTSTKEEPGKSRGGSEFANVEHEWQGANLSPDAQPDAHLRTA
jgi:hypothetical protein